MSSMCKLLRAQSMGGSAHSTISPWKLGKLSSWFRSPSYSHIELPSLAHQQGKPSSLMGSSAWTIRGPIHKIGMDVYVYIFIYSFIYFCYHLFIFITYQTGPSSSQHPEIGLGPSLGSVSPGHELGRLGLFSGRATSSPSQQIKLTSLR